MCMYAYMFVGVYMYIYMCMYMCGGLSLILGIIFGHLSQGFLIKPELADVSSLNSQHALVILSLCLLRLELQVSCHIYLAITGFWESELWS